MIKMVHTHGGDKGSVPGNNSNTKSPGSRTGNYPIKPEKKVKKK